MSRTAWVKGIRIVSKSFEPRMITVHPFTDPYGCLHSMRMLCNGVFVVLDEETHKKRTLYLVDHPNGTAIWEKNKLVKIVMVSCVEVNELVISRVLKKKEITNEQAGNTDSV